MSTQKRSGPDALLGKLATARLSLDQVIEDLHTGQHLRRLIHGVHGVAEALCGDAHLSTAQHIREALKRFGEKTGFYEIALFRANEPGAPVFTQYDAWTIDTGRPFVEGRVVDVNALGASDWLEHFRAGRPVIVSRTDAPPAVQEILKSVNAGSLKMAAVPRGPAYRTAVLFVSENPGREWTAEEDATLGTLATMFDSFLNMHEVE